MFLKRLEIGGFKSFAAKSVLDFEGEGVAAIVGPNGSGKSNVADAIRWVLGEQSYKTIRSKKSEDVIFSGSNAKSRASFARVSMILDNTARKAPIDFTEVEISRSVYRDGSSEYLINGKKSRLLDVAELLAKSGFGQSTYSVIGQGMVDSMLFYGPAERKVLFDEAAGVRQYEIKREQTLKKLEDTATNLIRIKDILSELNPRLSTLKRQAEKAKEKDNVKASLIGKQVTYFASIWDRLGNQEATRRQELEKLIAEEAKITEEVAALNKEFTEILNQEQAQGSETRELQQKIAVLEEKKDEYRQKIFSIRARIEVSFSPNKLTQKEISEKIAEVTKSLQALSIENILTQKKEAEASIEKFKENQYDEKIRAQESKKDEVREKIYFLKAEIAGINAPGQLTPKELEEKIATAQKELNDLRISEIENRVTEKNKEIAKFVHDEEKLQLKIEQKRAQLRELSEELASFDFGKVGSELSGILESQNLFLIQVEAAQELADLKHSIDLGREISKNLEGLIKKVDGAKEGRIAEMSELQLSIEKIMTEKEQLAVERNKLKGELLNIGNELSQSQNRRQELKKEIEELKAIKPIEKGSTKELEAKIAVHQKEIEKIEAEIAKLRQLAGGISELKSHLMEVDYQLRKEEDKKRGFERELERLNKLKPVDLSEKEKLEKDIEANRVEIQKIETEIQALKVEIGQKSGDYQAQGKKLNAIKDGLYGKQKLLTTYGQEITNLRVELARVETKKQDLKTEIVREMGSEEALAGAQIVPELQEDSTRSEIEKLKNKLYAIGEIDPEVETEFVEVNERVTFMSGQIGDLENAKLDLEKLISELDLKIKKQFEGSFKAIADKFSHFFNILFAGGEAKLELVRQKDIENGEERFGIEITAVPPGKRVRSLSALSGGERTLTSLALLFAILSVNPSPFCVLDEVDAALDETNTVKFLKIVKELSGKTQFIFISHNRETMKSASHIYGITMDDTHASKILSVKLEEALEVEKKVKKAKVAQTV